jgi:hypothetical protein
MLALAGCGNSKSLPLVPVRGKVTFSGNNPPAAGSIAFVPLDSVAGQPSRPGSANFGVDGTFQATSYSPGDGLLPGRYGVNISCSKERPNDEVDRQLYSYMKKGYQPPDVVVEATSSEVTVNFDVPLNQPK